MFGIDHGFPIVLPCKERPGFENSAGLVCFDSANLAAAATVTFPVSIPLTMIKIEQSGIVAEAV